MRRQHLADRHLEFAHHFGRDFLDSHAARGGQRFLQTAALIHGGGGDDAALVGSAACASVRLGECHGHIIPPRGERGAAGARRYVPETTMVEPDLGGRAADLQNHGNGARGQPAGNQDIHLDDAGHKVERLRHS